MKTIKTISLVTAFIFCYSCINQKDKDKAQIEETVSKFWMSVQSNDEKNYLALIEYNEDYKLAILNQLHFLNRNYNSMYKELQSKKIQIKDTNEFGESQKCVEYLFVKPNSIVEPLSVKLFFYKPTGYNKIFNLQIIGNLPKWEKAAPSNSQ